MTPARAAYRWFALMLALLILYALVSLIAGLKFLPGDLTQDSLPFNQVSAFAAALLDLAVVSGLLGGGVYVTRPPGGDDDRRLLRAALLLWSLLVVVTTAAGLLNLLIPLNVALAVLKIVVVALVVADIWRAHRRAPLRAFEAAIRLVWTVGMSLSIVSTLVGLIPTDDFLLATALHALASGANVYIAYVLAAVALAFWLMHRFSDVTPLWAGMSLYTVAGLLALAGALVTLSGLETLGAIPGWLGSLSAVIVPLLLLIVAAHSYRALSDRNPTETLAAHWTALGVLLLLLGIGVLGGAQAALDQWTAGTRLSDLLPTLTLLAVVAILLGMVNQAAAEMRGQNRRVTGLAPFWLVAFGIIGGGLALAGAGLVQVYLERVLSVGYVDTQALVAPLYVLWIGGLALFALGVIVYALVLWLRRPRA